MGIKYRVKMITITQIKPLESFSIFNDPYVPETSRFQLNLC